MAPTLTLYYSDAKREEKFPFTSNTTLGDMCEFIYKKFGIASSTMFDIQIRESSQTYSRFSHFVVFLIFSNQIATQKNVTLLGLGVMDSDHVDILPVYKGGL